MRKFFLITLILSLISCTLDDDNQHFYFELLKIEEVELPETLTKGETFSVKVKYYKPSNCHNFFEISMDRRNNEFFIAVTNIIIQQESCKILDQKNLSTVSFDFLVGREDSYIFKFWQGKATDGSSEFLIIEVPTTEAKVKIN